MSKQCELRRANGILDVACEEDECIYWRVAGHLGVSPEDSGCAIQHFALLEGGENVATWLLSVKERLEKEEAAGPDARRT